MRRLIGVLLILLMVGCSSISQEEENFAQSRDTLERDIEILKLKIKKSVLEKKLNDATEAELGESKK